MNKIQKPEWLLFAEKLRVQIDNMKPTKSGKREARAIYAAPPVLPEPCAKVGRL